jgi:hypothetical protein
VRDAKAGSRRLGLGSKFEMSMRIGIPYSTTNEVVEYEENRRSAWQTRDYMTANMEKTLRRIEEILSA